MVCYLNLMNFCTEWNASNWQSVIKQNRREYKSPKNTKEGTSTIAERKGEKSIPEPTVHGGVGVHKEIAEMRVYMWTPMVGSCQESWGLVKAPVGDLYFHGR